MAISDKLTQLQNDIESAYSSIQIKGGTIPTNKNTNIQLQKIKILPYMLYGKQKQKNLM